MSTTVLILCVGNHEMISDERPETNNSLESKEGSEPSNKRVSYANIAEAKK